VMPVALETLGTLAVPGDSIRVALEVRAGRAVLAGRVNHQGSW
jgi:hypothetical protein